MNFNSFNFKCEDYIEKIWVQNPCKKWVKKSYATMLKVTCGAKMNVSREESYNFYTKKCG